MFALKPDFELSQQRIEAFWRHELIDRPVVQFPLSKPPDQWLPLPASHHTNPAARWQDAAYQAEYAYATLSNQYFLGDSLPVAWPNLGPDVFAALYGCQLEFGDYGTSWSSPVLLTWDQADAIHLDWDSPYLTRLDEMTDALLAIGQGHFITGITDLHMGADCLAALRGPLNLAVDLVQQPDQVRSLLGRVSADFYRLYDRFYHRLREVGQPISTWTPLLADGKYYLPSNDYSALISRQMFVDFFLPAIQADCRFLDYSLYHLDGPDALRHLDALLQIPELDAIQFVPTPGDEQFSRWAQVYKHIQAAGKSLQVTCTLKEIDEIMEHLAPEGVYLVVGDVPDLPSAEALLHRVNQWPLRRPHGEKR